MVLDMSPVGAECAEAKLKKKKRRKKKVCSCICETPKHSVPQRQEVMCVIGLATRLISQSDSPLLSGIITETLGVETAVLM